MGQTILKICFAFLFFVFSSNYVQANENINTGFVELTADESQTVIGGYNDTTNAILCIIAGTALIASAAAITICAIPIVGTAAVGSFFVCAWIVPVAVCSTACTTACIISGAVVYTTGVATSILVYDVVAGRIGCCLLKKGVNVLKDFKVQEETHTNVHKNYNNGDLSQFESSTFNSADILQLSMSF